MMRGAGPGRVWPALGLAAVAFACHSAETNGPPTDAQLQLLSQRTAQYYRKAAGLSDAVSMKLVEVTAVPSSPLLRGVLELTSGEQSQQIPIVMSRDAHYLVPGQLIDLTTDPFKGVMQKISLTDEPIRGNAGAPVTIVEYSDFQCPFCAQAYKTLEDQVLKEYGDKVRLVFKNFPLTIHPWAESAALAAACVRRQNPEAFWKLYDSFFRNQAEITLDNVKDKALGAVRDAGVDGAAFSTCFDNKAALSLVKADQQEAGLLAVRSTPTFFINGRRLEGAVPFESFEAPIEESLGSSPETQPVAAAQPG